MPEASHYNFVVPLRNGRAIVFNSMSAATALLEPREFVKLRRVESGRYVRRDAVLRTLMYGGFVLGDGVNELALLEEEYRRRSIDASEMVLTIAPTLACNFVCDYCFQGAEKPCGAMTSEVQDAILRMIESYAPTLKRVHVAWYGGEPLLARGIVERLSDRIMQSCAAHSLHYDSMIVTNGYHLDADTARSLVARKVTVAQVTLDGAKKDHDDRRMLLGGQGTFDRLIRNIREVIEQTLLRVTVRINIDARNSGAVPRLLHYLADTGLARRTNFNVYFAPVEAITQGCHLIAKEALSKSEHATLETELQRLAFELGLASLPYPRHFRGLCGAVRPRGFVVTPNGDLHKCWDTVSWLQMRIGTVFEPEKAIASDIARRWSEWTPFANEICRDCKLLPTCAGSCAHKFVNPEQTLGEAGSLPCPTWKYQMKERIVALAESRGTIAAEDCDPVDVATTPGASPLTVADAEGGR